MAEPDRTRPNLEPAHLDDGKDHPQYKQTHPADGASNSVGGRLVLLSE